MLINFVSKSTVIHLKQTSPDGSRKDMCDMPRESTIRVKLGQIGGGNVLMQCWHIFPKLRIERNLWGMVRLYKCIQDNTAWVFDSYFTFPPA